ncbi:leukocyte receptor cluster member 9 [Xyrauchen texanus]|uniref:leukocyte receptor cluster member 9 n=1 Tax=Xyrauchen texanus TaxID=154827 RepID=UPI0022423074|nr:leukocyte receptor cluster member 9 [Xyrauchen texanus]XP_052003721.1 leukocyte receptor cluster member 9 [Xyrauchen texanus]XP_052003722.1 leukocyte receptor cluster member 9 [Xyrauchen texanus]
MEIEEESTKEIFPEDSDEQIHRDEKKQETSRHNICQHFLLGRCHFGDRCRLSHSVLDVPQSTQTEEDHRLVTEKQSMDRKNRKMMNKEKKEKQHAKIEREGIKKKPRMRTADDVISRILWDTSVDPADFMVGHLDRFLGVLERPFSEFSWDAQVCDCDFSEELALPRHRIQYFSYKGQRVWDKESRTDRVFGSTGQTIVPPFGDENQQQENVIPDAGQQEETANMEDVSNDLEQATSEFSKDHYDVVTTLTTNKRELGNEVEHSLAENTDKESCVNTILLQDEPPVEDKKMQSTEDLGLTQLAEELLLTQKGEESTEIKEEWKDSWDGKGDKETEPISIPQEPRSSRPPRRPTHFICFRVDSPAVLQAFLRIQRKVLLHVPQSEPLWVNTATLHVTLSLLVLKGPEEVSAAAELLRTTIRNSHKPPISVTFTPKLKHFNGTVLHVMPQPLSDVQSLNTPLQDAFSKKGWLHRHSRCPSYHLTLAKAEERFTEKMFEGIGSVKLAKDINFGKLEVNKLYLCVNGQPKTESGFYKVVCNVQLPNV